MADGSSSAAFEQFCLLAKSQRGRAVVALIQQALSNKKVFVVGELLAMDNIQALRGTEFEGHLKLLELFAYGTYREYLQDREQYPEMNDSMTEKLRILTIVSLAYSDKNISYETLKHELDMSNVRDIEDLIIDTIYLGLLDAKLDQAKGIVHVHSSIARDVRPEQVDAMIDKLTSWGTRAEQVVEVLEKNMKVVRRQKDEEASLRTAVKQEVDEVTKVVKQAVQRADMEHDHGFPAAFGRGHRGKRTRKTGPE